MLRPMRRSSPQISEGRWHDWAHPLLCPGYGNRREVCRTYHFLIRLKSSVIVIVRAPPSGRKDIGTSARPHNLEANTVSDATVED